MPRHMSEALDKYVVIKAYVDANNAGNIANRRSHSGIIIYVNNAPIIWYSKRHKTVEASSFVSEFVAIRISTEMNKTTYDKTCSMYQSGVSVHKSLLMFPIVEFMLS